MNRRWKRLPILLLPFGMLGCSDELPTSEDGGLIPVGAETVELRLPFDAFAVDFRVFGGFGSAADVAVPILALDDDFESRPMVRFRRLPPAVSVIPPGEENAQADSSFTPYAGRVVLFFDTLSFEGSAPFRVEPMVVESEWDLRTANWELAVDTLGNRTAWSVPGGGPLTSLGVHEWDPAEGDSIVVQVDSLTVNRWADTTRFDRGLLLRTDQVGARLRVPNAALRVMVRSEVNPDTTIQVSAQGRSFTTVYHPEPELTTETILVGGAPARRASFRLNLPAQLEGNPEVCARVSCPIQLTRDRILFAAIGFHTRTGSVERLQPRDSIVVDLRPVLAADRLPRSPLGSPLQAQGKVVAPELFGAGGGAAVEIPVTFYLRDLLRSPEGSFQPPPATLAFLSALEPTPIWFGSFYGPGTALAPYLRVILTLSEGVPLP